MHLLLHVLGMYPSACTHTGEQPARHPIASSFFFKKKEMCFPFTLPLSLEPSFGILWGVSRRFVASPSDTMLPHIPCKIANCPDLTLPLLQLSL